MNVWYRRFDMGSQEGLCIKHNGHEKCARYAVVEDPFEQMRLRANAFEVVLRRFHKEGWLDADDEVREKPYKKVPMHEGKPATFAALTDEEREMWKGEGYKQGWQDAYKEVRNDDE